MLLVGADIFFFQVNKIFRHFPEVNFADDPTRYSRMAVDVLLRGILAPGAAGPTTRDGKSGTSPSAQQDKE
jgi:TetR/AcrR family transcriptional regulator